MMTTLLLFVAYALIEHIVVQSQDISSCIASDNIVHNWNLITNLENKGWSKCYSVPYSTHTTITAMTTNCPTGQNHYLFVGALSTSDSQYAIIGAYAPSRVLTEFTTSSTVAIKPPEYENTSYNVYWYNYLPAVYNTRAFGFANNASIKITWGNPCCSTSDEYSADTFTSTNAGNTERLSWSYYNGGARVGSLILGEGNNIYQKVIYYKHCPNNQSVTSPPTKPIHPSVSSCILSTNVVHHWNLKTYLTDQGWTRCYFTPYNTHTTITDMLINCPTGQDHYLFVGALSTSLSQYALVGAYAPSRVLSDFTTSSRKAQLPPEYENTTYNIYWYNYLPAVYNTRAFGFANNASIKITWGNPCCST
eukprot:364598_1